MKRQGGGTGLYRRLGQRGVYTVKTQMGHSVNGEQKQNGSRKTGPRRGETRDVRNVSIWVPDATRSKRGLTVEDDAPKREDESSYIERC